MSQKGRKRDMFSTRWHMRDSFKNYIKEWNAMTPEDRAAKRDELNAGAIFSRCEEVKRKDLEDEDHLDRGDFIIARVIWDGDKEKYHDHWAIVNER